MGATATGAGGAAGGAAPAPAPPSSLAQAMGGGGLGLGAGAVGPDQMQTMMQSPMAQVRGDGVSCSVAQLLLARRSFLSPLWQPGCLLTPPEVLSLLHPACAPPPSPPAVQAILRNPELMRTMLQANPAVRQMMEANPEVSVCVCMCAPQ